MKFTQEIIIHQPLEKVIELFDNPDNLQHWQPGFLSVELLEGMAGQPGAKSRLRYQMGKQEIEMIERITKRDLPAEFSAKYEAKNVENWVVNRFERIDEQTTRWQTENRFKFTGLMRLMGFLMPGAFRKQSYVYLEKFKTFAEQQ